MNTIANIRQQMSIKTDIRKDRKKIEPAFQRLTALLPRPGVQANPPAKAECPSGQRVLPNVVSKAAAKLFRLLF